MKKLDHEPRIVRETADLRIYEDEPLVDWQGRTVIMHRVDELEAGRWESFYAIVRVLPDGKAPGQGAAVALGRRGGASTSEAKQAASRANGRKGGRPRKAA